jgi:SAM-dependent methyltransferase
MNKINKSHEQQSYPSRNPEDERKRLLSQPTVNLEVLNHCCYQGKQSFQDHFRALVASGGSGDATIYLAEQLRNSQAEVVHVDTSDAAIAITKERAKIRGLTNITYYNTQIEDLGKFRSPTRNIGKFHLIDCSGMLNHMPSPLKGLKRLATLLEDDGVINLFFYGKYGRTGSDQIQQIMKLINADGADTTEELGDLKRVIAQLPATNWLKKNPDFMREIQAASDSELYDLLLHSSDIGYTIPMIYTMLAKAKLHFGGFSALPVQTSLYQPQTHIHDPKTVEKINLLPPAKQYEMGELLSGCISKHLLYVTKAENATADPRGSDNVPFFASKGLNAAMLLAEVKKNQGGSITISGPGGSKVLLPCAEHTGQLLELIDGERTIGEIVAAVKGAGSNEVILDALEEILLPMGRMRLILLRHESTPASVSAPLRPTLDP